MTTPYENPSSFEDPLLEPPKWEDGFQRMREGFQLSECMHFSIDFNFEHNNKTKGFQFDFTWTFEKPVLEDGNNSTENVEVKSRLNTCTNWGKKCLHALFNAMEVPFEIPDANSVNESTGEPRKSYLKALVGKDVAGDLVVRTDNIYGKKIALMTLHKFRCNGCTWSFPLTAKKCTNSNCGKEISKATNKIYTHIDHNVDPIAQNNLTKPEETQDTINEQLPKSQKVTPPPTTEVADEGLSDLPF